MNINLYGQKSLELATKKLLVNLLGSKEELKNREVARVEPCVKSKSETPEVSRLSCKTTPFVSHDADRAFEELKNFAKAQYQKLNDAKINFEEPIEEERDFDTTSKITIDRLESEEFDPNGEMRAKAVKYNIPIDKGLDKDDDEFFKLEEDIEEWENLLEIAARVGVEHNYDDYDPAWLRTRIRVAEEESRVDDNDGHRSDYYASIYVR